MFQKLKQLSKETAIYGLSTIVGRFLNFILVPFYTNIFLPEEYGIVTLVYAYVSIMNIIFIYGMDAAYLKFAGMENVGDDKDNFSTPFIAIFLTALFLSLIIILLKDSIVVAVNIPPNYDYVIFFVTAILFFDANGIIPFIKLRLKNKAKKFAAFKVINIVINVGLNFYLILVQGMGIEAVFISNLSASFLTWLILIPEILKDLRLKINFELLKKLLKFGLPYLPAGFAVMFVQVADKPILEHLTNFNTVGIYQANYKLGIFMMLYVMMFQYAWQPFFLQNAKEETEERAKEIFAKVLTYFLIIAGIVLITLSLFIDDVVTFEIFGRYIIGPDYWSGLYIVPVILFAYIFNGMYVIFTAGIYIKEKSIYVPVISGVGAAANVGLNFLLIPVLGIMGAAIATLISYLAMATGYYIVTQKVYKINYENKKIIKIFSFIILTGGIYYYLLFNVLLLFIYKIILLLLFLSLLFLFVIDKEEIQFLKNKLAERKRRNN